MRNTGAVSVSLALCTSEGKNGLHIVLFQTCGPGIHLHYLTQHARGRNILHDQLAFRQKLANYYHTTCSMIALHLLVGFPGMLAEKGCT